MPRNGTGTYTLPQASFVPGTTISSAAVNSDFSDIATALTDSLAADGQTTMTGPIRAFSGSAAAPGYAFNSDPTQGFFDAGAGVIGVAIAGTEVATITSQGFSTTGLASVGVPIGTVLDFAGSTAPTGWYLCFGQSLSTSTYAALFAVIGYTYGGSGANFNLPDCRGRTTYGVDNMGGVAASRLTSTGFGTSADVIAATGGQQTKALVQANLPNVNFNISGISLNDPGHNHSPTSGTFWVDVGGQAQGAASPGQANLGTNSTTGSSTTGITISSQGSAASGGSGTALATVPPGITFNKMIFAGV